MLLAYFYTLLLLTQAVFAQQSTKLSARELDSLLQDYAFRAFVRPRTGIVYDGSVPANLTGVRVAALRLRSGSLRRRGVVRYEEFHFPIGVVEQPYVERLVLVYHNLGNWSASYYPLPGYRFLAPILGILAYDASDLTATNLSELDVRASGESVSVTFPDFGSSSGGISPMCVRFGLDGSVGFDNVVNRSTCLTTNLGHFSIVVQSGVSPAPEPVPSGGAAAIGGVKGMGKRGWIIGGSVVGGAVLFGVLAVLFACVRRCRRRKKIRRMEEEAEMGVALPMTSVGNTRAPVASETRTRPLLENEFVP